MSVNIVQNGTLIPIAGKTVPAPTPDYVDEQFDSSKQYSKGMTCIEGNVRYRYINSTATSGHRPPDTTYWEVLSVSDELKNKTVTVLWDSNNITSSMWTDQTTRLLKHWGLTSADASALKNKVFSYPLGNVFVRLALDTSSTGNSWNSAYFPIIPITSDRSWSHSRTQGEAYTFESQIILPSGSPGDMYACVYGSSRNDMKQYYHRIQIIALS